MNASDAAGPAREDSGAILVGTASWTDPTLLACGRFYPPGTVTAEARLRYYASRFPIAEVDSSYYALPTARNAHAWATRTPPAYVISIKAFRLFTGHQTPLAALDADLREGLPEDGPDVVFIDRLPRDIVDEAWRRFVFALEPLRMAGKLGTVHFQFPRWVEPDARGRARVAECVARLEDHIASVEFRHRGWLRGTAAPATLDFLRDLGAAHTVVDAPQGFEDSVPAVWDNTRDDVAVVRMHGRNAAAWHASGSASSSRFNYEYSVAELEDMARRVRALAQRVRRTHVILNTNFQDQGMRNAQGLMQALQA
ncbi:DUF72 domain-containing protein [Bordetella bronchialis]|uniref:DUF72 domain-containing protein n=1 Tax=Bordetella bronchialis TaxID=463025 RepID=A0A193FEX0_9BORD|nr:DUF72 domain-containing protein [Bordetella bronchialis]ANN66170.1 hypothetical protein BAU06_07590 [Bordetella bronchialis]ANN71251.1 hypothetical protein BAU08_07820 [Bordetella bronchialis]